MIERAQAALGAETWGDLLTRRRSMMARHQFVARRHEQEQFRLNYLYEVPQVLLFVIQGPPGIGKTALLTKYRGIAAEHSGLTAFVSRYHVTLPHEYGTIQLMETLSHQLAAANTPLTSFREVHREYLDTVKAIDDDPTVPGRVWDLFGGAGDPDPLTQRAWDTYFTRTLTLRRAALVRNPVSVLTERFIQDLNAWSVVRRITLCFDDWLQGEENRTEALQDQAGLENWLLNLLCGGQLSTNIWFVITTRSPLGSAWQPLAPVTRTFELQPLPRKDVAALLVTTLAQSPLSENSIAQNNGQTQPELTEATITSLVDEAKGNPLSLSLLVATKQSSGAATVPCDEFCLTPYVDGLKPVQQAALLKCTSARRIDEGVLTILLGEEAARDIGTWLTASPVLTAVDGTYRIRATLRDALIKLAQARIGPAWEAAHETLFAYYRQRCELGSRELKYANAQWRQDKLEALYHELVAGDQPDCLWHILLAFLDGIRHFCPWAGAVVLTWLDAVHVRANTPTPAAGSRLSGTVYKVWTALIEKRWEDAHTLVNALLSAEELMAPNAMPEIQERLQALRSQIAARLTLHPEEETKLNKPNVIYTAEETSFEGISEASLTRHRKATAPSKIIRKSDRVEAIEYCNRANEHLRREDYEAAVRGYEEALAHDPDYTAAYYNRGVAYHRMGALDSAIADFTHVIELDPGQLQAHRQRGLTYARKGDHEQAIQNYDAALATIKASDESSAAMVGALYYDRATAHRYLKAYEQAIADYTEVLEHAPNHIGAYINRGLAHSASGNQPEALRDLNKAIALAPDQATAYHQRGQIYSRMGRFTEALKDYDRALNLNPRYTAVHNNRGLLYMKIEAYTEAIEAYQQAMALQPDWATPYYNAACAAASIRDDAQACIWLARAIGLREAYRAMALRDPDLAPIRDNPKFRALVQLQEA